MLRRNLQYSEILQAAEGVVKDCLDFVVLQVEFFQLRKLSESICVQFRYFVRRDVSEKLGQLQTAFIKLTESSNFSYTSMAL
jgi:hypothetical protein